MIKTIALLLALTVTAAISLPSTADAANAADFKPGRIIDDTVFYNQNSMDTAQIQRFLESKVSNCDYHGTQPASDWGYPQYTHAQFAERKRTGNSVGKQDTGFHVPPYKCLTHYSQTTPQMEAASGYCSAVSAGNRTAAQIINDVAKACGINPQVLIILLEKEQSLVTDNWPLNRQLRHATGFACPDTAPCDPAYEGFFYQVYNAARQFKVYQAHPNNYNYISGRTNRIYWHPDLSRCGSSQVHIENQATAALYIYTPYRPNQAALNNLYGTGDSCSSYGNRNFWRMFTDWFGSVRSNDTLNTHPDGTLINIDNTIFLIYAGGLHHIANPSIFETHNYRWEDVKPATTGDKKIPFSWPVNHLNPGVLYADNHAVYTTVYEDGQWKKKPISYQSFQALNYRWDMIRKLPLNELPIATSSSTLFSDTHPDGTLIKNSNGVFYIDGGTKRYVSPHVFESHRWRWSDIVNESPGDKILPVGANMLLRMGSVIYDGHGLYVVEIPPTGPEIKRPIGPWDCFDRILRYRLSESIRVPTSQLPVQTGPIVTC